MTEIDEQLIYKIDGNLPEVTFSGFQTSSEDCAIEEYQICSEDDLCPHPDFNQVYTDEGGTIRFQLAEEKLGEFNFYIKAIADNGKELETTQILLKVECGPESAGIISSTFPDSFTYAIDGNIPFLDVPYFQSDQILCPIDSYEIYQSQESDVEHPDFVIDTSNLDNVRILLNEEKLGVFTFYLKVGAEGGAEWWSNQMSISVYCVEGFDEVAEVPESDGLVYSIDGNIPSFQITEILNQFQICQISNY